MTIELLANAPLSPSAPQDIYFCEEQDAWILSRHQDVLAALRSADLAQAGPPKTASDSAISPDPEKLHSEIINAFLNPRTDKWQVDITESASLLLQSLTRDRPVDLVAEFIRPWCLGSAVALTGADPVHTERLAQLVSYLCESDAAPQDAISKLRAKDASQELDPFFPGATARYRKSLFLGIGQTVPAFLASAWAALLQHRSEWNTLRAHPDWVPKATEELLRYAGPVHSLFRHASREISIRETRIAIGDRLILRLASANRDPTQFTQPDLLDIKRGAAGHLALSSGSHYCIGASLVRTMTSIASQAILRYTHPELSSSVEWSCGTMLIWPSSLRVLLGGVD